MNNAAETRHRTQAVIGGRILRMKELRGRLGLTASHIYAMVASGRFPKPFPIVPGGRATGWLESTIDAYLTDCASTTVPKRLQAERDEAVKAEREACAKLCDHEMAEQGYGSDGWHIAKALAETIRARGKEVQP